MHELRAQNIAQKCAQKIALSPNCQLNCLPGHLAQRVVAQVEVDDGHANEHVVLEPHERVAAEVEEGEARQEAEGAVVDAREAVARQQDLREVRRRVEEVRQHLLDL